MSAFIQLAHVGFHKCIGKIAHGLLRIHSPYIAELCATSTSANFHQFYLLTRSDFSMTPQVSHLLPPSYQKSQVLVSAWLEEDTPFFDYGSVVFGEAPHDSFLIGTGWNHPVLGCTPFVDKVFCILDCA